MSVSVNLLHPLRCVEEFFKAELALRELEDIGFYPHERQNCAARSYSLEQAGLFTFAAAAPPCPVQAAAALPVIAGHS